MRHSQVSQGEQSVQTCFHGNTMAWGVIFCLLKQLPMLIR